MRNLFVVFCALSTLAAWDFNRSVIASPKPESLQIVQSVPAISKEIETSKRIDTNSQLLSSKEFSAQKLVTGEKPASFSKPPPLPDNQSSTIGEFNQTNPIYLTPVSSSAADLLQTKTLQAQNSVPKEQPAFPTPPPPPPDQPPTPGKPDGQLRKPKIVRPRQKQRRADVRLLLRSSVVTNADIAATVPREDTAFINSATLRATPKLGPETSLVADLGGSLVRFSEADGYNSLNTRIGIQQRLGTEMSGQLGWLRRELFGVGSSNDLVENSILLSLARRDLLSESSANKLTLNSGYDFLAIFSEPNSDFRNRLSHRPRIGLYYDFTPKLQGRLSYRLILDDFIRRADTDIRQQVSAQTIYKFNRNIFVAGSVSYLFGSFTNQLTADSQDFDGFSFAVNVGVNIPLF